MNVKSNLVMESLFDIEVEGNIDVYQARALLALLVKSNGFVRRQSSVNNSHFHLLRNCLPNLTKLCMKVIWMVIQKNTT